MPSWSRSLKTYTPGRISVMPVKFFECIAVGVEPAEAIGQGMPAARNFSAAPVIAKRSCSATAEIPSIVFCVIGLAGMGHDACQLDAGRGVQHAGDVEQTGQGRRGQSRAPPPLSISISTEKVSPSVAVSAMARATVRLSVTTRRLTPCRRSAVTAASFEEMMLTP